MRLLLSAAAAAATVATLAVPCEAAATTTAASPLSVATGANLATYSLSVDGQVWLSSSPTRLHGVTLTPAGDAVASHSSDVLGAYTDTRQDFACASSTGATVADGATCFATIVRDYTSGGLPLVVFLQNHTAAREHTASSPLLDVAKEQVLSAFPSFAVAAPSSSSSNSSAALAAPDLGYLTYFDQMVGGMENGTRYGAWTADANLVGGSMGGPTVLFDAAQSRAMVLSPWKNFLAGSAVPRRTLRQEQRQQGGRKQGANAGDGDDDPAHVLEFGLIGSISSVPAGFEFATAAYVGSGVNDAVRGFGACLLKLYGKGQGGGGAGGDSGTATPWDGRNGDVSLSKLGLSTDNGAYLYYNTGPNATSEEDALLQLHARATADGIPFSYVLLDSWWYYKGVGGGVKNWTATLDTFPRGLASFTNTTGWPVVGHNRYWSVDTDYARQNGGDFDFILEPVAGKGIPVDPKFWPFLLGQAKGWGLTVYEQDWLHNEWESLSATLQSATLSREWLLQMGAGAQEHGLFIQYCMAYSRFALASVEVAVVDQIRVSDDYYVDLTHDRSFSVNAYIGTSSMLAAALGLAPSKDVFWSSSDEPGYPSKYEPHDPAHYPKVREDHPALEAALATLSAGPVSPGDGVGLTNKSLVLCSCAADGTLLKPSYPATPVDAYFTARAGIPAAAAGPRGELYATYTTLPVATSSKSGADATYTVSHFLAMDLAADYDLTLPAELPGPARREAEAAAVVAPAAATDGVGFFTWATNTADCGSSGAAAAPPPVVQQGAASVAVRACGKADFQVLHAAPEMACGGDTWGLLGEAGKWVPVSPQRFRGVACAPGGAAGLEATVAGSPGESVRVLFAVAASGGAATAKVVAVDCVVGAAGTAVARSDTVECK